MANTVANVVSGKPATTGGVLIADLDSTLPTDATTALDAAFVAAGYIGDDGLVESGERTTDKIKAWGGDIVKVVQTDYSLTYVFTFIESVNSSVLQAVYGEDNVTVVGGLSTAKLQSDPLPHKAFVFEVKDGDAKIRIVVPDGQITAVGETTYSDATVVGYQVTVEAFRDTGINANAVKYIDDGSDDS